MAGELQGRDRTALPADAGEVYAANAQFLIRLASVLVGPSDAEDVVSAAVLRAFSSRQWPEVLNQRAYLYRTVVNEARNHGREAARRRARHQRVAIAPMTDPPDPRPEIREAVMGLSVRQRAAVYLAYWEDMTDQMIAEHLGISAGSVRRHLGRARQRLRSVLHE